MSDQPRTQQGGPVELRPCDRGRHGGLRIAVIMEILATAALVTISLTRPRADSMWPIELALGALAMLAGAAVVLCCARVERSIWRMTALLRAIRAGSEPVGSLSRFGGFLDAMAGACHDLAHDLRMERARTAQLESETSQRVAHRTQALERTIGALRQQAARDALTGLFNRRSLDAYLPDAIAQCGAKGLLCALMIDIDHFKPLNDTLGHAAGDQMLKSVAQIIRSTIRENDLAFRSGGDEFVVVLEECDEEAGRIVAERLTTLGNSLGRTFRLMPPPALSIGLATLADLKERTAEALLSRADAALYEVKALHHAAAASGRWRNSA